MRPGKIRSGLHPSWFLELAKLGSLTCKAETLIVFELWDYFKE
jgi:hypothetical protein